MVRLSLGNSSSRRRTGRGYRKYRPNRLGKFSGYRPSTRLSTATVIPRSLYPPQPADYCVSLRLAQTSQIAVAGTSRYVEYQSTLQPWTPESNYAEYFRPLMRIYSRAQVYKCVTVYQIQNVSTTPLEICSAVINYNDAISLPATGAGIDRLSSYPEAQYRMLAGATGGPSFITLGSSVDNSRFLGQQLDSDTCVVSAIGGALTAPFLTSTGTDPQTLFVAYNRQASAAACLYRKVHTFHIRFFDRHDQSLTEEI